MNRINTVGAIEKELKELRKLVNSALSRSKNISKLSPTLGVYNDNTNAMNNGLEIGDLYLIYDAGEDKYTVQMVQVPN